MGFDDDSWSHAVRVLREISKHVDLKTYHRLGSVMKSAFTHANIIEIIAGCEQVAMDIRRDQSC